MNYKEQFQMRKLTTDDLDQFYQLLRYAFQVTSDELFKSGWDEDEMKIAKIPVLQQAYVLGWFYRDRLASQIAVYPMEVNIQGNICSMGGITGVTTYPEYAGRGLIHSLMQKCLEYMKQEKQLISFLYPYSIPFYRKMGWEIVSDQYTFRIKDTQLPKKHKVSGMVERVNTEHEDLKRVYKFFAIQHHGALLRDSLAWGEYWRWDVDDIVSAIYYNEEHQPLGYLIYHIKDEVFSIKEMIYLNQEARLGIWNYISSHFSMVTEVIGKNYTGEPLAFLLEDSEITETVVPYIMARIVDAEPFIRQYAFQEIVGELYIHLKIHDAMAPWNEGDFVLSFQNGKTDFTRNDKDHLDVNTVELDIQTLTTMLMGYKRPSYLYDHDRLNMEYYMVQVLEQLIPPGKPYFSDYF